MLAFAKTPGMGTVLERIFIVIPSCLTNLIKFCLRVPTPRLQPHEKKLNRYRCDVPNDIYTSLLWARECACSFDRAYICTVNDNILYESLRMNNV